MKHRLSALASLPRVYTCPYARSTPLTQSSCYISLRHRTRTLLQTRNFAASLKLGNERDKFKDYNNSNARPAADLNNNITQEEKDHFAKKLREDKGKQIRTPWQREGSDVPPVARQRSAGAMTKGKSMVEATHDLY